MSTTPGSASSVRAARRADPALFSRLVDDAAVFPPGLAPLDRAVREHLTRTRYAGLVGPLVIPATAAGDAADLGVPVTVEIPREGHDDTLADVNVLAATRWAIDGAPAGSLASLLSERDPDDLVPVLARMTSAEASGVRSVFTAYGCCTVTDPIGELAALGLLDKE